MRMIPDISLASRVMSVLERLTMRCRIEPLAGGSSKHVHWRWYSQKPMQPIKELGLSPRVLSSLYNGAANVFWSLMAFAPVSIFCYRYMGRAWLWAFVAASLIAFVIPASKLSYLE